jgi:hypothetical protein
MKKFKGKTLLISLLGAALEVLPVLLENALAEKLDAGSLDPVEDPSVDNGKVLRRAARERARLIRSNGHNSVQ